MDLKRTRFAVLCENVGSVAHRWYKDNIDKHITWSERNRYYVHVTKIKYNTYDVRADLEKVKQRYGDISVYTEKQFADLLNKSNNKLLNYNQY